MTPTEAPYARTTGVAIEDGMTLLGLCEVDDPIDSMGPPPRTPIRTVWFRECLAPREIEAITAESRRLHDRERNHMATIMGRVRRKRATDLVVAAALRRYTPEVEADHEAALMENWVSADQDQALTEDMIRSRARMWDLLGT